jgi:hypothetical protein
MDAFANVFNRCHVSSSYDMHVSSSSYVMHADAFANVVNSGAWAWGLPAMHLYAF